MSVIADPLEKFHLHTTEFLEYIRNVIEDLSDLDEIDTETETIEVIKKIIEDFNKEDLIDMFINCHKDWHQVAEQNVDFILETMPKTYSEIPFDVTILTLPLQKYLEYQKAGRFRELGLDRENEWVVNDEDFRLHWEFFRSMIYEACFFIHFSRKPIGRDPVVGFVYSNPSFKEDVPLALYLKMFNINI